MSNHYPSLVLLASGHDAHWFRVEEDRAEEIDHLRDHDDTYTDHEGKFGKTGGEGDTMSRVHDEEVHKHIRHVAKKTHELFDPAAYRELVIAIPEQYKHLIEREMKEVASQLEVRYMYGNYTHRPTSEDVRSLFAKSLQPS